MAAYFSKGNLAAHFRYPLNKRIGFDGIETRDLSLRLVLNRAVHDISKRLKARHVTEEYACNAWRLYVHRAVDDVVLRPILPKYAYKRYFGWLRADIPNFYRGDALLSFS